MANKEISLKVICWNIGSALQDIDHRMQSVCDLVAKHSPDLVFFQEFPYCQSHIEKVLTCGNFVSHIYHECSPSHVAEGWTMGLCIFSKYPLRAKEILPLEEPDCRIFYKGKEEFWHPKFFMGTGICVDGVTVDLFTGHSFPFYRYGLDVQSFSDIFLGIDRWIAQQVKGTYLICSDFNCRNAIDHMPFVRTTHRDIYANMPTRPTGLKTDAVIVPKSTNVPVLINRVVELDHNFLFAELLLQSSDTLQPATEP